MWEFTREEGAGGRSRLSGVANLPELGEGTQTHSVGAAGTCLVPLVETVGVIPLHPNVSALPPPAPSPLPNQALSLQGHTSSGTSLSQIQVEGAVFPPAPPLPPKVF